MVLVFWCLMRNYVERNSVVTLYHDFLSSPINLDIVEATALMANLEKSGLVQI